MILLLLLRQKHFLLISYIFMKKVILGIAVLLALSAIPTKASAAIALDATSNITSSGWHNCGTGCSWNHTVGSSADRILLVYLTSNLNDQVTGVTYNGVSMTQLVKKGRNQDNAVWSYIYYLVNPASGTHSVAVSLASSDTFFMGAAASYTGVTQSAPEAYAATSSQSTSGSVSVTTISDNDWLVGMFYSGTGLNMSAGSNTTFRGGALNSAISVDTNGAMTPAGTYSLNMSNTSIWTGVAAAISPSSAGSITGSGTSNRIAKFTGSLTIGNSLLSDDGSNTTLTAGNFFLPISSLIDTVTNGAFNFGTTNATTMTFGRSGQNMIVNSKLGISTSTPVANLDVNGSVAATSVSSGSYNTSTNCNSSATQAVCGSATAGSVAMSAASSTLTVYTTGVTANSTILITENSWLGNRLGITCNTTTGRVYSISSVAAGSAFVIKSSANPVTNKACLSYLIIN
jgi:hypothetical protein